MSSVGATGTGAIDPTRELAAIAREYGAWLHIDAAWAGVAAVCPELRWINDGVELADSYCTNPHKWLLTNFDCTAFWVADRAALVGALSILPEYLRNAATESGAVIDYRDWHVPLGRRFRALKLWAVIRWYGVEGLQAHIRAHVESADDVRVVAAGRRAVRDRRAAPARSGHLPACARATRPTMALMQAVNESGEMYPDPHLGQRAAGAADGDRRRAHRTPSRRGGLGRSRRGRRLSAMAAELVLRNARLVGDAGPAPLCSIDRRRRTHHRRSPPSDGRAVGPALESIDLDGRWVLPGLWDTTSTSSSGRSRATGSTCPAAESAAAGGGAVDRRCDRRSRRSART